MVHSIHNEVKSMIVSRRKGTIIMPTDFKSLGHADAVKMALSRLAKEKTIVRLAQGIYLYPQIDPELGTLSASIEAIAAALAKRDRARIVPSGAYAMNRLGFSTQVPMNVVYLTDGSPRKIQVGRRAITFRRASPRHLALKGKISSLVVIGLQALHQDEVTPAIRRIVADALRQERPKDVAHDILLAPERVAKIMREALDKDYQ